MRDAFWLLKSLAISQFAMMAERIECSSSKYCIAVVTTSSKCPLRLTLMRILFYIAIHNYTTQNQFLST